MLLCKYLLLLYSFLRFCIMESGYEKHPSGCGVYFPFVTRIVAGSRIFIGRFPASGFSIFNYNHPVISESRTYAFAGCFITEARISDPVTESLKIPEGFAIGYFAK